VQGRLVRHAPLGWQPGPALFNLRAQVRLHLDPKLLGHLGGSCRDLRLSHYRVTPSGRVSRSMNELAFEPSVQ
jgi:hypothetical protein